MQDGSPLELDAQTMRAMGHAVTNLLVDHITSLRDQPAFAKHSSPDDPVLLPAEPPAKGKSFDEILMTLRERVIPFHAREPHPGFMAYVPSCPTFPSLAGEWIATGFNFYAGVWPVATGPNRVEVVVLDWFRRWLSMPEGSSGLLTTGGSAANLTAVTAARHMATGGDAAVIPRLVMYTSDQAHSSVNRAGWIAGISRSHVRSIPSGPDRRMDVAELRAAIARDRAEGLLPFVVVASAGTTNTGTVDPLHDIATLCEREKIWMHVDAAYGGFAILTTAGRRALSGIERADSVTLDPHKWLFVPFECGCLMVKDPAKLAATFSIFPDYLKDVRAKGDEVNFADYGEQLTRYSRAFKVWMSVNYFGVEAISSAIDRGIELTKLAEKLAEESATLEVLSPAQLGIMCFRAKPEGVEDAAELDALNERVLAAINAAGKYFISSTRLDGKLSLRVCILGFRTEQRDVEGLMHDASRFASELSTVSY